MIDFEVGKDYEVDIPHTQGKYRVTEINGNEILFTPLSGTFKKYPIWKSFVLNSPVANNSKLIEP